VRAGSFTRCDAMMRAREYLGPLAPHLRNDYYRLGFESFSFFQARTRPLG